MRLPDNPWPDRPGFRGWAGVWQGVLPAGGIVHVDAPWDWGSRERYRVAGILAGTRLVDDMVTRTIHGDHDRMVVDYVKPRVMEKILGVALVSNPKHWNWNGLWDPLLERTFSGWVRRLTVRMAKGCAKRVLRTRTKPFSAFERDDGSNPLQEHEDRRGVLVSPPRVVFTRPMDGERVRLARWARRRSGDEIVGRLQRDGWLPGDLDSTVDPGLLARFMVAPIPRDDRTRRVVLNALGSGRDERRLCGLWYESQVRLLTVGERDELWRLARSVAGSHGLLTPWRVFTVIAMSLYDI